MVAFLTKTEGNDDFADITKTANNETQIYAKVAGKSVVVTESSVRSDLQFNDEDGATCLTNVEIFENLELMGYERDSDKLSSEKALFSPHCKYLIHTILHCLSLKSTAWNEFSTNVASAVICLAKGQKFNFSKLIFDVLQVVIAAAEVVNAGVSVSTAEPKTPPTTTTKTLLKDDDVTVIATLVQMNETSKAKSIIFEDVEESANEQREGKAPMVEEDVPPLKKTQKQLDDERARLEESMRLQAEQETKHTKLIHLDRLVNVDSNEELSKILLGENEPREDFATRMVNLLNKRKKFFDQTSSIIQIAYQSPQVSTQPLTESPLVDSSLSIPIISPGDDPIAYSRVTVQQVQGRQGQSYSSTCYKSNATSSRGNSASGQARVVKCYNYQGEGHMARQCTQPKRPRNATWYKDKAMLAEAQEAGQILDEEQLAFLADPGVPDGQAVQTIIPNNVAFQTEDLDTYDSDCYQNPFYLKKAQRIKPTLYDGIVISDKHVAMPVIDDEEILILEEEKLTAEQAFWFHISNPTIKSSVASPVKMEAPKELPKVSLVNKSLKNLKFHIAKFNNVVKIRTTPDARTEAQLQEKDTTICKLKEIIKSMREKSKEKNVNYDYCEIETKNVELENSVAKLLSENERLCNKINHVKQDLKAQIQDKVFVITSLKNGLRKVKGKEIVDSAAQIPSANIIVLGMFKLDLELLAPRLLQNRETHIDYLKYTQEQADILQRIVEQAKAKQPSDKALDFTGVDLLSGSRDINLYTISLDDMLKTSLICLLSKASKTKSWWSLLNLQVPMCIDVAATFRIPLTNVGDLYKLINDIEVSKHDKLLSGLTNADCMETLDALGSICNSIQANRNNAYVTPCMVLHADDSINLNVDESTIPSDPIVQSVNINTKSTSYAGAAGASAKNQPNVNSNFRTLVADLVFDGVNVSIPHKLVKKVSTRFEYTLYGYFIGKRMAFPVVEYYARNNWAKHGLKRIMMNSKGFFI
ncbi:hypothetical protein Tco_1246303 [Tanacetum coccineum]